MLLDERNIPAYAGKTSTWAFRPPSSSEHPRIRGENFDDDFGDFPGVGTSPHTRGKREPIEIDARNIRNIPAYAGKTDHKSHPVIAREEHPRIRGENHPHFFQRFRTLGTSPHTRGKPAGEVVLWFDKRNIPAYAGKTCR